MKVRAFYTPDNGSSRDGKSEMTEEEMIRFLKEKLYRNQTAYVGDLEGNTIGHVICNSVGQIKGVKAGNLAAIFKGKVIAKQTRP
jgi:hypothetical protein